MPKARAELAAAKEQGYYSIGRAAELSGVTAKMIRHYEALELIAKAPRTVGNYRVYSAADVHTLRFIHRARTLGFSMEEISALLSLWRDQRRASAEVKRLALKHIAELDSKIEELQSMRSALAGSGAALPRRCTARVSHSGRPGSPAAPRINSYGINHAAPPPFARPSPRA